MFYYSTASDNTQLEERYQFSPSATLPNSNTPTHLTKKILLGKLNIDIDTNLFLSYIVILYYYYDNWPVTLISENCMKKIQKWGHNCRRPWSWF